MKRFLATNLLGLMIVACASAAHGQASPYNKNLEPLLPVIGKWVTEFTLQEDMTGVGKEGDTVSFIGIYSWTKNRNAITLTVNTVVGDKVVNVTNGLIVWDASSKKIIGLDAYAQGGMLQYEVQVQGNKILLKGHGASPEGLRTETTVEYRDIGKDRLTGQFINQKKDGKEIPDGIPYKLVRIKK